MPVTVVKYSLPSCQAEATYKVATPWHEGPFDEVQTLGYCCRAHAEQVVARISQRPQGRHPAPSEIRIYTLPRA